MAKIRKCGTYSRIKRNMMSKVKVSAIVEIEPKKKEKGVKVVKHAFGDAI